MISQKIRKDFLEYFKKKGHIILPSSPILPHEDPTLLFVNAGMNQFKDVFLGKSRRDYARASTCQKCIRVGGKHNDLENVGHTTRHLTFFEMLGNFSFGDYFKKESIQFGFEVAVNIFHLEIEKIYATVLHNDDEAFELWRSYLPAERIIRMGEKDNFWAMGETGPCGPSSELLYDRGESFGKARTPAEDIEGERFFEFWNHVFMQFNRTTTGNLEPLPKKCVDTGAGLERIALLKRGGYSVFETDILREIIAETENLFGIVYDPKNSEKAASFHVIADHLRCLSFAIADGVLPSNIDRGYILRKVLRRSVRYGRKLGVNTPFLNKLLPRLVSSMGEDYPEIAFSQERISQVLLSEEENFLKTLQRGGNMLNQIITTSQNNQKQISGEDAFKLKDTYGLPLEEILLLAKDDGLTVDCLRFEELEKEAKERSRSVHKSIHQGPVNALLTKNLERFGPTVFQGYEQVSNRGVILAILRNDQEVDSLNEGEEGAILLDTTVFYSEKGGQIGDEGIIVGTEGTFQVLNTKSPIGNSIYHFGIVLKGRMALNNQVTATLDLKKRERIANNHTATHLLHWALEQVLGNHIKQAGSLVDAERFRFDFNHHMAMTPDEIFRVENLVNEKIRGNTSLRIYECPHEDIIKRTDIKQFFGDKYGSMVRVVDIDFSKELCGGTHTTSTGTIGFFKIIKESSIASGVRRIEAATGYEAEKIVETLEERWRSISTLVKSSDSQVLEKIKALNEEKNLLESEVNRLKRELLSQETEALLKVIESHKETPFLVRIVQMPTKDMKNFSDLIFEKAKSLALFLITQEGGLHVRISKDLTKKGLRADDWLKECARELGGKGGGNAELAQGSVPPEKMSLAWESALLWMKRH